MRKQNGSITGTVLTFTVLAALLWVVTSVKMLTHEEIVSGIVYNNSNDKFISGNTTFSIRASEDTYVNAKNESSYCLPPNSPYIPLIKEAARDKKVKVNVVASKNIQVLSPWGCMDNVTVTKQ